MFKRFRDEDVTLTKSPVREKIVLDRRFFSGGVVGAANNVASPTLWTSGSLSGGLYLAVYDRNTNEFPRQKLYSVAFGYTTSSVTFSGSGFFGTGRDQKVRMYDMFARTLLGNKSSRFIIDGQERDELIFLCINRNQFKDRILPQGIDIRTQMSGVWDSADVDSVYQYVSNNNIRDSFGGLYVGLGSGSSVQDMTKKEVGLCFLDKGVFVIDPFLAIGTSSAGGNNWSGSLGYDEIAKGLSGSVLDDLLFGIRHRINKVEFINESQMRTTFYKCVAENDEFNYSSNPSFTNNAGRIIPTSGSRELQTRSYITTIALMNKNNEVIAIGKTNKPIKKDFKNKVSIYVRLHT